MFVKGEEVSSKWSFCDVAENGECGFCWSTSKNFCPVKMKESGARVGGWGPCGRLWPTCSTAAQREYLREDWGARGSKQEGAQEIKGITSNESSAASCNDRRYRGCGAKQSYINDYTTQLWQEPREALKGISRHTDTARKLTVKASRLAKVSLTKN